MANDSDYTPSTTEYQDTEQGYHTAELLVTKPNLLTGNDAPWPGNSYIISYQNTSQVLTFVNNNAVLTEFEGKPTQRWSCHSKNGWFGFANDPGESTRWLGFTKLDDTDAPLRCASFDLNGWEMFCVAKRPDDGFVILARINDKLKPVGAFNNGTLSAQSNWDHWWSFTKAT
ncbi:hypothetical protein TWF730_005434 [Orbilia blumenaviensis]|uniref:Uncharacterized protein n=1 Tax=Orbilia blumenaviensis TaxID=1796055 RepID=A0AAV9VIC9_9PEZI